MSKASIWISVSLVLVVLGSCVRQDNRPDVVGGSSVVTHPTVTLRTTANLWSEPSATSMVVRVVKEADSFNVFAIQGSWVLVGGSRGEGWVPVNLLDGDPVCPECQPLPDGLS